MTRIRSKNHLVNTNITTETFCGKKYAESLKTAMYNAMFNETQILISMFNKA